MHLPCVDRAAGRHQRLAGDLPAEHPLPVLLRADAAEDVDLDPLQVEQGHEFIECSHSSCTVDGCGARGRSRSLRTRDRRLA